MSIVKEGDKVRLTKEDVVAGVVSVVDSDGWLKIGQTWFDPKVYDVEVVVPVKPKIKVGDLLNGIELEVSALPSGSVVDRQAGAFDFWPPTASRVSNGADWFTPGCSDPIRYASHFKYQVKYIPEAA